jgi:hypothetical protein
MIGPTSSETADVETTTSSSLESMVVLDLAFLSFLAWLLLLLLSGAEPTTSEAGGDPARDISVDVPCSDIVGVDGWLREIDDNEGCREDCFSIAADRVLERSVAADAGPPSFLGVVVVVSRRVLGLLAAAQSGDFVLLAAGVLGSDSMVVGVATILCGRTCGFNFEGDSLDFGLEGTVAEMSILPATGTVFPSDKGFSSTVPCASGVKKPPAWEESSSLVGAEEV